MNWVHFSFLLHAHNLSLSDFFRNLTITGLGLDPICLPIPCIWSMCGSSGTLMVSNIDVMDSIRDTSLTGTLRNTRLILREYASSLLVGQCFICALQLIILVFDTI